MKGKQLKLNAGGMSHLHNIPNKKYIPTGGKRDRSDGSKQTSKSPSSNENLESRLDKIDPQATVDDYGREFDNIVAQLFELYDTQQALSLSRNNLEKLGLKNFYRLAEFIHSETRSDCKIEIYQPSFNTLNNVRKYLQGFFSKNIATDAKVYLESYEKENGKLQKINHLYLGKGRTMSKDDFPFRDGILKLHIQEGEIDYLLEVSFKLESISITNKKQYSIVISPIFPKKQNKEEQTQLATV